MLQKIYILNARTWLRNILYSMIVLNHKIFLSKLSSAVIVSMTHKFEKNELGGLSTGIIFSIGI